MICLLKCKVSWLFRLTVAVLQALLLYWGTVTTAVACESSTDTDAVQLKLGQTLTLDAPRIELELLDIKHAAPDCHDCSIGASLRVSNDQETTNIRYRISGNMPDPAYTNAREKTALGYRFILRKLGPDYLVLSITSGSN